MKLTILNDIKRNSHQQPKKKVRTRFEVNNNEKKAHI